MKTRDAFVMKSCSKKLLESQRQSEKKNDDFKKSEKKTDDFKNT